MEAAGVGPSPRAARGARSGGEDVIGQLLKAVGLAVLGAIAVGVMNGLMAGLDAGLDGLEKRRPWLARARAWAVRFGLGVWILAMVFAVAATCSSS